MFNLRCSKRSRLIKVLGLGAIMGLMVLSMGTEAVSSPSIAALEDMFATVAEEAGKSVVSITAIKTGTVPHIDPFEHFFGEDFFEHFFPRRPPPQAGGSSAKRESLPTSCYGLRSYY